MDDFGTIYVDGKKEFATNKSCKVFIFSIDSKSRILAIEVGENFAWKTIGFGFVGFMMELSNGIKSDESWKCAYKAPPPQWIYYNYVDSLWVKAPSYGRNGDEYTKTVLPNFNFRSIKTRWVGHPTSYWHSKARFYCRKILW